MGVTLGRDVPRWMNQVAGEDAVEMLGPVSAFA